MVTYDKSLVINTDPWVNSPKVKLSPITIDHFSRNYMDFIALAPYLDRAVAYELCGKIWRHIYNMHYRVDTKAA